MPIIVFCGMISIKKGFENQDPIGSGMVDDRIIVYDYACGLSYELSDRCKFDYVLTMQGDSLIVEKRGYMQDELVESGELVFLDDTIQIKREG